MDGRVVQMLRALGDPTRARIFEFLCSRCCAVALDEGGDVRPVTGATVGEVCCHITGAEQFSSTISFHLKELRLAGLIHADKNGKYMVCSVRPEALREIAVEIDRLAAQTRPLQGVTP